MKWYVGWDWRDATAYRVFVQSLKRHSSIDLQIIPLIDRDLRRAGVYWRSYRTDGQGQMWDDRDGKPFSTAFSFTRFAVPILEGETDELVVFSDPDMLVRTDPAELIETIDRDKAVSCVKHNHEPPETIKIDGVIQTRYYRKNWSSLMVFKPVFCHGLTKYSLNNSTGQFLHAFCWVPDELIGDIDERWNWLEGWSDPAIDPAIVHFTRGTPDMPGHEDSAYADEWNRERYRNVIEESAC